MFRGQPSVMATHPDAWPDSTAHLNMNHYANKKSAAESMLDVALLMANASQLKAVLDQGPNFTFYTPVVILISISLCLQVTVGVLLIFIVRWNLNDEQKHWTLDIMENLATVSPKSAGILSVFCKSHIFLHACSLLPSLYTNSFTPALLSSLT
uniref:Ninjurin 1 n=1 Tax=Sphaeramia orbicularis TaxID=375764 RepID=A0A672YGP6_9TELE